MAISPCFSPIKYAAGLLPGRPVLPASRLVLALLGLLLATSLTTTAQSYNPNGVTVAGGNGQGNAPNQLARITGVYVDPAGMLYIADKINHRVQRWAVGASQGVTVAGGNGQGSAPNQLDGPEGVFVDQTGNVYVSDEGNHRVQRWAPGASQGVTVAGGNRNGRAPNQLNFPQGLYVDPAGNVYVADFFNDRVQRWAPGASQGVTVAGGNGEGSAPNQLDNPTGVWLDAAGNVYVTDLSNNRVQRWAVGASQGETVAGGNGRGSAPNQLNRPEGLFVSANGTVYIADTFNDRIQRWATGTSQGVTVAGGNGRGGASNQLNYPQAVYMTSAGTLYVGDESNYRIQQFNLLPSPTLTGFSASPNPVCAGQPVAFTATVGNADGVPYSYTLTNGAASSLVGTASGPGFSQSLVVGGSGSHTFTLTVTTGGGTATTSLSLAVTPQSPDYQPLADLYNATNGSGWTRRANWLTGCSPCGWQGVSCDGNGRVINLTLDNNNLIGSLPASLSALTSLRVLRLVFNNKLVGPIPASLSALTSLQELSLQDNQLSGNVPPSLANLSNLRILNLGQNQLNGPVPSSLSALTGLQVGYFNNNQLSGCFPASLSAVCGKLQFGGNPGLPGGGNFGAFCATGLGSDAFRPLATANPNPVCAGSPVSLSVSAGTSYAWSGPGGFMATTQTPGFIPATTASSGVYSVTVGNGSPTCTATASVSLTVNALPVVSITGLGSAYCKDAAPVSLTGSPMGGGFTIDGTQATQLNPANLAVGQRTVVYSYTNASGCSTTTSQTVTIKATPPAPTLLTQGGGTYPASQSAVTVDLNSGSVNLVVGGCGGTIAWSGPNNTSGNGSTITVSTAQPGVFTYRASCQVEGCTSPLATASVTVTGRLTVLHRDVDNYATNNAIQPLLQLVNQGTGALPLSAITLRYYLTVEGSAALSNLLVNYAQVGNQNVRLRYVPLQPAQQGASGYVEVSFTDGAGNLAAGANSGPIQTYFAKSDYSGLNETDDYSYNPVRDQLTATLRITAYYNGVLIAGVEPGSTTQIRALRALTESKNGPSATQISTSLEVRNEGNVPVNYSELKVRYYFTSDGPESLQVEVDEGNVQTQLVGLSPAVNGANYYLEIRFNQSGQLAPGSSTGTVRYRISKPQGGRFDQTNDYSYQEQPQDRSQNSRVTVQVGQEVVWGTPPTGAPSARQAASNEPTTELQVTVLGNPVAGSQLNVAVTGAQGQPLRLSVTNLQGRTVSERVVERAVATEQHTLSLGSQPPGVLLLRVSTPTQHQTVKVVKPD